MNKSCIKLQLFGCSAISADGMSFFMVLENLEKIIVTSIYVKLWCKQVQVLIIKSPLQEQLI